MTVPRHRIPVAAAMAATLMAAGCGTNQQTVGAGSSAVAAIACGAAGHYLFHSTLGAVLPATACGAIAYFVGSEIGRRLDEADREKAAGATQQALAQSLPPAAATSTPQPKPSSGAARKPKPAKATSSPTVTWKSADNSGAHGFATVVAAHDEPDGAECRSVREVAYIKGEEVVQNSTYCRSPDGDWRAQQA